MGKYLTFRFLVSVRARNRRPAICQHLQRCLSRPSTLVVLCSAVELWHNFSQSWSPLWQNCKTSYISRMWGKGTRFRFPRPTVIVSIYDIAPVPGSDVVVVVVPQSARVHQNANNTSYQKCFFLAPLPPFPVRASIIGIEKSLESVCARN